MKATNHPSDKMTIKNNNGDLLLEIDAEGVQEIKFKDGSKYTGAEIDAAIEQVIEGGGGGSGILHVIFTFDDVSETLTANYSFTEIFNALENQQLVIFSDAILKDYGNCYYANGCGYTDTEINVYFNYFGIDDTRLDAYKRTIVISDDNTITENYSNIVLTGSISS